MQGEWRQQAWVCCRSSVHGPHTPSRIQASTPPRRPKDRKMFVFLFLRNNDGLFLNKTLLSLTFIFEFAEAE